MAPGTFPPVFYNVDTPYSLEKVHALVARYEWPQLVTALKALEGTDRLVVHSHVDAEGKANDANATHFQLRGSKMQAGKSIGMPLGWQGDVLMDPEINKKTPCPFRAR